MIRAFCLRLLLVLAGFSGPAAAQTDPLALAELLRLDEVIAVLQDEGLTYGAELDQDMLDGQGGAFWEEEVARIYQTDRITDAVTSALADHMTDQHRIKAAAFFDTALGQRILSLEIAARIAMADGDIEHIARTTFADLKGTDGQRLKAVSRFVSVNDLIERNVAGALNANYYFLIGMGDGGIGKMTEDQIVAEVWAQESETRADTESWLFSFLLMAYHPLSNAELQAYINYSDTPSGQALNAALFDGFDAGYRDISYDLGQLVARTSTASDL